MKNTSFNRRFRPLSFLTLVGIIHAFLLLDLVDGKEEAPTLWKLPNGSEIKAELSMELAGRVFLHGEDGRIYQMPVQLLESSQQDWLRAHPRWNKEAIPWKTSSSPMAKNLLKRTRQLNSEQELVDFDPGERDEPMIYVIYTGAAWCAPCREFVNYLRVWYDQCKLHGIDNFEVFFLSSDRSSKEWSNYIKGHQMRWPAVRWASDYSTFLGRFKRRSIPGLVVTDRNGNILLDAHMGDQYQGAQTVLNELKDIVYHSNPGNPLTQLAFYEPLRKRYLAENAQETRPPRLVYGFIPPEHRAAFGKLEATLRLTISHTGHVTEVQVIALDKPEVADALVEVTSGWRFLPALDKGKPVEIKANLPIVAREDNEPQ